LAPRIPHVEPYCFEMSLLWTRARGHRLTDGLYHKGDTSTHAQRTDRKMALGAYGELPGIYLDAWRRSRRRDPSGRLRRRPVAPRVPQGPPPPPWGNGMRSAWTWWSRDWWPWRRSREGSHAPTWALAFTRYCFASSRLCTSQSSFHSPGAPALPTLLQYHCTIIGQYTTPLRTSRLYAFHYIILVMAISCKGQLERQEVDWVNTRSKSASWGSG